MTLDASYERLIDKHGETFRLMVRAFLVLDRIAKGEWREEWNKEDAATVVAEIRAAYPDAKL